jgi:hypothetical protein
MSLAHPLCTGNASNSLGPRTQQAKSCQCRALFLSLFLLPFLRLAWTKFSADPSSFSSIQDCNLYPLLPVLLTSDFGHICSVYLNSMRVLAKYIWCSDCLTTDA